MKSALFALMAASLVWLPAQSQAAPTEGRQYRQVAGSTPARPAQKIEVIEFFAYSCPHCAKLAPMVEEWARNNASRVILKRVHVNTLNSFGLHQRLFFTLQKMRAGDDYTPQIFRSIHQGGNYLVSERGITTYVNKLGIERTAFQEHFKSASVEQDLQAAQQLQAKFGITRWPAFVVDQRFVTDPELASAGVGDLAEEKANSITLELLSYLVSRAAAADHAAAPPGVQRAAANK